MNRSDFIKKYGLRKTDAFDRMMMRSFGNDQASRIHDLRPKAIEAYTKLKTEQGELFEDELVTMDEDDLADIRKRKKKALFTIAFVAIIAMGVMGGLLFLNSNEPAGEIPLKIIVLVVSAVVIFGSYFLTIRNYNSVLNSKTKRIIKGVITDIVHTEDEGPALEISLTKMVLVFETAYRSLLPGDIVTIEIFSENDTWMKRRISKIGNLLDKAAVT